MPAPEADEFYIGYLPEAPRRTSRRMKLAVGSYVLFSMVVATVFTASMTRTGKGTWEDGSFKSFSGRLIRSPYPVLMLDAPIHPGDSRTALLVDFGKRGAQERLADVPDGPVTVTGTVLARDGRCMIEFSPDTDAVLPAGAALTPVSHHEGASRRLTRPGAANADLHMEDIASKTLRGEIVDPKCFLGAMKPGEGKTHKACAVRCISGGIPPTLVSWDDAGRASYFLLLDERGAPAAQDFLDSVGETVDVTGRIGRLGDLPVFCVQKDGIRRP